MKMKHKSSATEYFDTDIAMRGTLRAMAIGRLALGIGSLLAPATTGAAFGIHATPELEYMGRVYGARAVAMGMNHLLSSGSNQTRWQRLSLAVDASDTLSSLPHWIRRDVPLRARLAFLAITGTYTALGVMRVLADCRQARS